MDFMLCYTNKNNQNEWEIINGEDAMHIRVDELVNELGCDEDDIIVFSMDDEW